MILLLAITTASAADTNQFMLQITNRLGISFPADAKVEYVETYLGREPLGSRTNVTHEWFAVVTMSPSNAVVFKHEVTSKKRDPDSQRVSWQDKNSKYVFGFIPGPHTIPKPIKEWWGEVKADTTIYLSEFKRVSPNGLSIRGGVMIFLSGESGRLWIWSYELPKKDTSFRGSRRWEAAAFVSCRFWPGAAALCEAAIMSYVVTITSLPLPDKDEEAWDRFAEIDEANAGTFGSPGPVIEKLYKQLSERYPCINEAPDSPWTDGPLRNNYGRDVAAVGIIYSRVAEVLPFVIETATRLGCTVLDGQDDKIHRPVGWQSSSKTDATLERKQSPPRKPWWKIW